jgi:hypothetical protein
MGGVRINFFRLMPFNFTTLANSPKAEHTSVLQTLDFSLNLRYQKAKILWLLKTIQIIQRLREEVSKMPVVRGDVRVVTNKVTKIIRDYATNNITDHFDTHEEDNGFLVEALSTTGLNHNCYIKVHIQPTQNRDNSIITAYSCDHSSIKNIVNKIYELG